MSMHKKPLTPLEEEGLRVHHLTIGVPSQLSDTFRIGMAWAQRNSEQDLPIHKANTDKLAELDLYCVQRKIGHTGQEAHEAIMLHCDTLTAQLTDAFKRMGIPSRLDMLAELENQLSNERIKYQRLEETHLKAMEQWKQESPAELDFKLLALTDERDALAAQVELMHQGVLSYLNNSITSRDEEVNWKKLVHILESNPQQCLAEIKAMAIEEAVGKCLSAIYDTAAIKLVPFGYLLSEKWLLHYAEKIRRGDE